jgi:CDP-paratose 2-epimerase
MKVLVTGGAGFIGSHISLALARELPPGSVVALDNLRRRGSELALGRLHAGGVAFVHGDVRCADDIAAIGPVDWLVECSAEPSVHAGYDASPAYVVQTNLGGLINCLDHLRRHGGGLVFLSTSRVYPVEPLRRLPLRPEGVRFVLPDGESGPGWSAAGVAETFPMTGSRSLYGATKLSAELLIEEYAAMYGLSAVINRCGVVAGPWQMGKVDQGFVALWMARHVYGGTLRYMGFDGQGRQVRDVLHVADLCELVARQIADPARYAGAVCNVGGGAALSTSLAELSQLCAEVSGQRRPVACDPTTRKADIPYYVSDCRALAARSDWRPRRSLHALLHDVHRWLVDERSLLEPILAA